MSSGKPRTSANATSSTSPPHGHANACPCRGSASPPCCWQTGNAHSRTPRQRTRRRQTHTRGRVVALVWSPDPVVASLADLIAELVTGGSPHGNRHLASTAKTRPSPGWTPVPLRDLTERIQGHGAPAHPARQPGHPHTRTPEAGARTKRNPESATTSPANHGSGSDQACGLPVVVIHVPHSGSSESAELRAAGCRRAIGYP